MGTSFCFGQKCVFTMSQNENSSTSFASKKLASLRNVFLKKKRFFLWRLMIVVSVVVYSVKRLSFSSTSSSNKIVPLVTIIFERYNSLYSQTIISHTFESFFLIIIIGGHNSRERDRKKVHKDFFFFLLFSVQILMPTFWHIGKFNNFAFVHRERRKRWKNSSRENSFFHHLVSSLRIGCGRLFSFLFGEWLSRMKESLKYYFICFFR